MNLPQAIGDYYDNYADFSGRTPLSGYWWVVGYTVTLAIGILIVIALAPLLGNVLYIGFLITHFIPGWSIAVRRLHDSGLSGWYSLLGLVPIVGALVLIALMLRSSEYGTNDWGPPADR